MGSSADRPPQKTRRKRGSKSRSSKRSSRVSSSCTARTGRGDTPAPANGHVAFFLFSALLVVATMTNFALHSYLPDHISSSSSTGDNGDGSSDVENEVQSGLRGGGANSIRRNTGNAEGGASAELNPMNRDQRPIDQLAANADAAQIPNDRHQKHREGVQTNDGKNEDDQSEILRVLRQAGISVDDATLATLPKWSDITSMYGPEPIIYGLDTCHKFQTMQDPADAFIGPAGIFNTGTNLLAELLSANCAIPAKKQKGRGPGMRWQVPWGKHNPVKTFRLHNVARAEKDRIDQRAVLPVVTTKDPYGWFGSMCRHQYAAQWSHRGHCPNLVLDDAERRMGGRDNGKDGGVPVRVAFGTTQQNVTHHGSLAGLWNDWYGDYYEITDYPRLIVRFEDIMISPKEVVSKVCECGGGELKDPNNFIMKADSAKGSVGAHKGASGLVSALTRYGDPKKRVEGMTGADLDYARQHLRSDLMEAFGYSHPPKL